MRLIDFYKLKAKNLNVIRVITHVDGNRGECFYLLCLSVFQHDIQTSTSVFGDGRISTHADPTSTRRNPRTRACPARLPLAKRTDVYRHIPMRAGRFVRFWASGGAKFRKNGDSLPRTPMNHREKCDATSFILAGKIRNRTNTQTNKQTVTDYAYFAYRHVWIENRCS